MASLEDRAGRLSIQSDEDSDQESIGIIQILPYLYLGDAPSASNKSLLGANQIDLLVNCASDDVENLFENDFKYCSYPIADAIDADIAEYFDDSFETFIQVKNDKQKVLVFSEEGSGRAPAIIIAYLMRAFHEQRKKLPLKAAMKFVQEKAVVDINGGFLSKLIALEKSLYGETSMRIQGKGQKVGKGNVNRGRGRGNKRRRGR